MQKYLLENFLINSKELTVYENGGRFYGASFRKFYGFGRSKCEAISNLAEEIISFRQDLDSIESFLEIENAVLKDEIENSTIQ